MSRNHPLTYQAPLTGHDWVDHDVLRVTTWLKTFVPQEPWAKRWINAEAFFLRGKQDSRGIAPLIDPTDEIAGYIFQAENFADGRVLTDPALAARIVPLFKRLGMDLRLLRDIGGVEDRISRLMLDEKGNAHSGLFELLVALAYRRSGWEKVSFVPEERGQRKRPDLTAKNARNRRQIECKFMSPSTYARDEKTLGYEIAARFHAAAIEMSASYVVDVVFKTELGNIPVDHLALKLALIDRRGRHKWDDAASAGFIIPANFGALNKVLERDDIYYGSSRMIELLTGWTDHNAMFSLDAKWRPADTRPLYADAVYQASVVRWRSESIEALKKRARHFRSVIASADLQLTDQTPGIVHVGFDATMGRSTESFRNFQNLFASKDYRRAGSRLRWVFGNYLSPEATTRPNETWAVDETRVPYKIGRHRIANPLPNAMLIVPEDSEVRAGAHWD